MTADSFQSKWLKSQVNYLEIHGFVFVPRYDWLVFGSTFCCGARSLRTMGLLSLTVLLSVLSPGHCCAPEDASIKIPVLSAKWRGSLETFYSPLSKLSGRQKFSQLWFWGLYQRQIFGTDSWQNVKISSDTSHVDVNDIHRLQHLDNVKGNFIDSDNVKPTYIHPKQGSAPKGVSHLLRSTWQISSLLAKHALSNCVCVYTQIYIYTQTRAARVIKHHS